MIELKHELPCVRMQGPYDRTYGGNQMLFANLTMQRCGCGLVGVLDILLYLHRYHSLQVDFLRELPEGELTAQQYESAANYLKKHGIPLVYPLGTTGLHLAAGLNYQFRKNRIPLHSHWYVPKERLWSEIEEMLKQDLPVIMSAGDHFPDFWKKGGLRLYLTQEPDSPYVEALSHYFTVTGMEEEWLRVSSWGVKYYIRRREFEAFVKTSTPLFSSILKIERRTHGTED